MSGTYKPIAGLSPDNQGPVNTIVAIVFSATSILFFSVRYAIGRQRLLQFDSDDVVFGVALCFGVAMSIVSNASVGAGLGRHQDALSLEQIERFFKLRWTTQLLAIIALAGAKLSIVLMFKRIDPVSLAPRIFKILIPVTALYTVICMCLIGFQCQLPSPWILNPKTCSTHGNVYYATTALNILTDLLLAGWILPTIWALQMDKHTKILVMSMFASRIAVCVADVGRFIVLRWALDADDQTWSELPWAILDQVVVHLSINHATLPRVHVFLSNLQTGFLVTQLTTGEVNTNSKGSKRSRGGADESLPLSRPGCNEQERSRWRRRQKSGRSFSMGKAIRLLRTDRGDTDKEGSISESPLRLQPEQDVELSTTIYADDDSSPSQSGRTENRPGPYQRTMSNAGPITSLPSEQLSRSNGDSQLKCSRSPMSGQNLTIVVHKTVERTTEVSDGTRKLGAVNRLSGMAG